MRKALLVAVAAFTISFSANSQSVEGHDYKTALGVKIWDGGGITLKHFFTEKHAGELIAYFWSHGVRFTGLYEIHGDIQGADGLKWYIGPGAHIGFYGS